MPVAPVVGCVMLTACPKHKVALPELLTVLVGFTVIVGVGLETHPAVLVNVKVTVPALNPVTKPPTVDVATVGLLLVHVPPDVGDNCVVGPTHIVLNPVTEALAVLTVMGGVGLEIQPAVLVNVKVAVPALTPVTTPALVTVATAGLLLTHVPPVEGDNVVVPPTQIVPGPGIETMGPETTVNDLVLVQFVAVSVNVSVTIPALIPVTKPELVTEAIDVLLLDQVPPIDGVTFAVKPLQTLFAPPKTGPLGIGFMVKELLFIEVQPVVVFVTVNV